MTILDKDLRTCNKGHKYYKSSNCPTCPTCEQERKSDNGFLSLFSAPARRELDNNGITSTGMFIWIKCNDFYIRGISVIPLIGAYLVQGIESFFSDYLERILLIELKLRSEKVK